MLLEHLILLVNDIEDAEDMPDYVYFTDATNQEVSMAVDAVVTKQSATEYVLTVSGYKSGWIYGSLLDLDGSALLPVYLENVTLTGIDKQNVSTTPVDGCIVIENIPRPDLQPANVTVTPASVDPGEYITDMAVCCVGSEHTASLTIRIICMSIFAQEVSRIAWVITACVWLSI